MEGQNKKIVCDLYNALATRDTNMVHHLLAPNIEWWFHGPPAHKFNLMQLLTGSCTVLDSFKPVVVVAFRSMVVVEGYHLHGKRRTCWVHAWTVENGKIITQVKEYLNTSVSVFSFRKSSNVSLPSPRSPKCKNVWKSELANNSSVPHFLIVL